MKISDRKAFRKKPGKGEKYGWLADNIILLNNNCLP